MTKEAFNIKFWRRRCSAGQALVEILVGIFVAGILIGAATIAGVAVLRSNMESKNFQAASALSQQLLDDVKAVAEADWSDIYSLAKGTETQYHVAVSGTELNILSGASTTAVNNVIYTRFFSVENVKRLGGLISDDPAATDDSSTQKIVSYARWPSGGSVSEVSSIIYLTRWRNQVSRQTDWSGGASQETPLTEFNQKFATSSGIDFSSSSGSIILQGF